jgi:four helix bundle protein
MNAEPDRRDLRRRTTDFALRIIRPYGALPHTMPAQVVGKQLLRSGTSVGAHHREARRARSSAEFVSKIETALQEFEETAYWLEILERAEIVPASRLAGLVREADELTAMLVASAKSAKARL